MSLGVLHFADPHQPDRLTSYDEKPHFEFEASMGVYAFSPRALEYMTPDERLDFPDLIRRLMDAGEAVRAYRSDCYWLDIGRHDDYEQALNEFERMRHRLIPGEPHGERRSGEDRRVVGERRADGTDRRTGRDRRGGEERRALPDSNGAGTYRAARTRRAPAPHGRQLSQRRDDRVRVRVRRSASDRSPPPPHAAAAPARLGDRGTPAARSRASAASRAPRRRAAARGPWLDTASSSIPKHGVTAGSASTARRSRRAAARRSSRSSPQVRERRGPSAARGSSRRKLKPTSTTS